MQSVSLDPRIINVLAKQQAQLVRKPLDGIILYQNEDGDVADIQADIIGPMDTPFHNGVFRCRLTIDSEFPQKPPKGHFLTKIFHPNVAQPSGEICVNTLKKDWDPKKWDIGHILQIVRCLLIVPFPESALNEEAGRLFMESYDDYYRQAKLYTQVHAGATQSTTAAPAKDDLEMKAEIPVMTKTISLGAASNHLQKQNSTTSSNQGGSVLGLSQVPNAMSFGGGMPDFGGAGAFGFDMAEKANEKKDGGSMFGGGFGSGPQFGENNNQQQLFAAPQINDSTNIFGNDNGGLFGVSSDGLGIGLGFNGTSNDQGAFTKSDNCFGSTDMSQSTGMTQPFGMTTQPVKAKKKIGGKCRI